MLRFQKMTEAEAMLLNPLKLAYLGDTVWETLVRYELICRGLNVHHMHNDCVKHVNAHAQRMTLDRLGSLLTEQEKDIVRRGRNTHAHHAAPKNQNPDDYAAATGFEALLGYLYLTGQDERLRSLFRTAMEEGEKKHG